MIRLLVKLSLGIKIFICIIYTKLNILQNLIPNTFQGQFQICAKGCASIIMLILRALSNFCMKINAQIYLTY